MNNEQIEGAQRKNSTYSDGEERISTKNMINILDDYSIKHQDLDVSFESGESEYPDSKNSLHIKLIYDRNKFITCPDNYSKA